MTEVTYDIFISVDGNSQQIALKEGETFSKQEALEALDEMSQAVRLTLEVGGGILVSIPNLQEKKVYFFAQPKGE